MVPVPDPVAKQIDHWQAERLRQVERVLLGYFSLTNMAGKSIATLTDADAALRAIRKILVPDEGAV